MIATVQPPTVQRLADIDAHTFLERVPISDMFVAPYQRPISTSQLGRMLKSGFDERKLGIITVSMRNDGRYAVLDGNHRRHLAADAGLTVMLSRVFIDLSYSEEAELYIALNTVSAPKAFDRFIARLEIGEATAIAIRDCVQRFGLRIAPTGRNSAADAISCVVELEKIFTERGAIELVEILNIIHSAWGLERSAYSGMMLGGLRQFWARYRDVADVPALIDKLRATTPARILASSSSLQLGHESGTTLVGKFVAALYDKGRRTHRLPTWESRAVSKNPETSSTATHRPGEAVVRRVAHLRGRQR